VGPQTAEKNRLERLLDIATIVAAHGETPSPPASQHEWAASFPEAALLRLTCRAAYGDRVLLAHVARMRLGKEGWTLLHRAAYMGDWVAAKEALLHASTFSYDLDRVDVGSVPRGTRKPLTPLALALDGESGSSIDCMEMLLALGASPERALEGLISTRHNSISLCRPRTFDAALISHVLGLVSPTTSPWLAWDVGLMLRDPDITAAATRRLVLEKENPEREEDSYGEEGDFDERIEWDLQTFSDRYGAEHYELLRALARNLPQRFFSEVLQAYASIEDTEALEGALGTDLAIQPDHRATALWAAAVSGMLDRVKALLDLAVQIVSLPMPPNSTRWVTPLAAAVENGHLEIVEYLVTHQTPA
jgi:hypothetical protein